MPHLLPENRSSAPKANCFIRELVAMVMIKTGVDLLADPDFVNLLFKMLLDPESIKVSEMVNFNSHILRYKTNLMNFNQLPLYLCHIYSRNHIDRISCLY